MKHVAHVSPGAGDEVRRGVSAEMHRATGGGVEQPPVEWGPRRYNKRSDAICNLILDGADSFGYEGENAEVVVGLRSHFLLHSDGAVGARRVPTPRACPRAGSRAPTGPPQ